MHSLFKAPSGTMVTNEPLSTFANGAAVEPEPINSVCIGAAGVAVGAVGLEATGRMQPFPTDCHRCDHRPRVGFRRLHRRRLSFGRWASVPPLRVGGYRRLHRRAPGSRRQLAGFGFARQLPCPSWGTERRSRPPLPTGRWPAGRGRNPDRAARARRMIRLCQTRRGWWKAS